MNFIKNVHVLAIFFIFFLNSLFVVELLEEMENSRPFENKEITSNANMITEVDSIEIDSSIVEATNATTTIVNMHGKVRLPDLAQLKLPSVTLDSHVSTSGYSCANFNENYAFPREQGNHLIALQNHSNTRIDTICSQTSVQARLNTELQSSVSDLSQIVQSKEFSDTPIVFGAQESKNDQSNGISHNSSMNDLGNKSYILFLKSG